MTTKHITNTSHWEMTDNGWQAVVSYCTSSGRWIAHLQFVEAPLWRMWAGCMFASIEEAQAWCKREIAHRTQADQTLITSAEPETPPTAWSWLWERLNDTIGSVQAAELRSEMDRRLLGDNLTQRAVGG